MDKSSIISNEFDAPYRQVQVVWYPHRRPPDPLSQRFGGSDIHLRRIKLTHVYKASAAFTRHEDRKYGFTCTKCRDVPPENFERSILARIIQLNCPEVQFSGAQIIFPDYQGMIAGMAPLVLEDK